MEKTIETTTAVAATASLSLDMRQRIEDLAVKREVWESTQLVRSNAALYQLISECLSVYFDLTVGENLKAVKSGFNDYINMKGYTFKASSPLSLKIVRCVFGDKDRRRISTYHTVLRVAITEKWALNEVSTKVAERGGVQEISLHKANAMTQKDKAIAAQAALLNQSVAVIDSPKLKSQHDIEKNEQQAVGVLTQHQDGTFSVHCIVHSATAVNAVLAAYFNANKSDLQQLKDQATAVTSTAQQADLIKVAAQAANDDKNIADAA